MSAYEQRVRDIAAAIVANGRYPTPSVIYAAWTDGTTTKQLINAAMIRLRKRGEFPCEPNLSKAASGGHQARKPRSKSEPAPARRVEAIDEGVHPSPLAHLIREHARIRRQQRRTNS